MKHVFIINPTSGKGKAYQQVEAVKELFNEKKEPFEILLTEYQGHATELAKRYRMSDNVTLYSVGGDGTAYEVLNGLQDQVPMAIIPAGTGNDYYRMLGYTKKDIKSIIKETVEGKVVKTDYGLANDRRFLNMMALGLDAEANQVAQDLGKKLPIPRSLVYAISALFVIVRPRRINLELEINGETIIQKSLLIAIMNGRWYGGGFQPTPMASIQDGLLDVCLVADVSFLRMIQLLPKYFKGTHVNEPEVKFYRSNQFELKTEKLCSVSCDGETNKQDRIVFKLVKDGLCLRVPQSSSLK
jgi:diacylglycerol kinase (ATP)